MRLLPIVVVATSVLVGCGRRPCGEGTEAGPRVRLDVALDSCNAAPVAVLRGLVGVPRNARVELDGSMSADPNDEPLTFSWALDAPSGSAATLEVMDDTAAFISDVEGEYTAKLVVSDGELASEATTVITARNFAPTADAGENFLVPEGALAHLSGRGSSDPDQDPLTYRWEFVLRPDRSQVALDDPQSPEPMFTPDIPGFYELSLVVSDGELSSDPDSVRVGYAVSATPPTVDAGLDLVTGPGNVVRLQATASDVDGDPLTFDWTFAVIPPGSQAAFVDPTVASPAFTPDLVGVFEARVTVSDGFYSAADSVRVVVEEEAGSISTERCRNGAVNTFILRGDIDNSDPPDPDNTDPIHPGFVEITSADFSGRCRVSTSTGTACDFLRFSVDPTDDGQGLWWNVTLGTNQLGVELAPGQYTDAMRASFADPGHPGLDVSGDGRGCNMLSGAFTIDTIVTTTVAVGGEVEVDELTASWVQHCNFRPAALHGCVHYKRAP
ncbi:MAG: hypothetical protein RMA76_40440 [Deltaproteobacteria bacterium]|jgi:hypothetical protein